MDLLNTPAALFAHEVANPLHGMSASLEFIETGLERNQVNDPIVATTIRAVRQEVHRLALLLNEFRSVSLPQTLDLKRSDLRKVIEEVLAAQLIVYQAAGVAVKFDFEDPLPTVGLDAAKMKQVILNLCKNAVEAMPKGGCLTVKCYPFGRTVILEIADTGTGIPEGLDVFALFKTTKVDGTGLGLAIVEQIVSAHNGTINYTSEPHRGTTFKIAFPGAM